MKEEKTIEIVKETLRTILIEKLNLPDSSEDLFEKNFGDIGLNSLLFVKLLINIEQELDIEFEEEFINISYVGNLSQLVAYAFERVMLKHLQGE